MQTVRKCRICGKAFVSQRRDHVTCSAKCRKEYVKAIKENPELIKEKNKSETMIDCKHKDCVYRGNKSGLTTCDYCYITGMPRGCKISQCDKYISGLQRKEQLIRSQREANIF